MLQPSRGTELGEAGATSRGKLWPRSALRASRLHRFQRLQSSSGHSNSSSGEASRRSMAQPTYTNSAQSTKVKRTPVVLNYPRRPAAAHFKVLQWNVLADGLAQHGDFCKAPPSCLEWEYRKPLLLQEILEADADIICLQELNHFEDLRQALSELGYDGAFREKHASPALKYEYPPDGMAVFYRRQRFACDAQHVEGRSFHDDTGREQSQGYLQILLHDLVVGRELLVVTTHLKAKDGQECEDMRYRQAQQLLGNIGRTLERLPPAGGSSSNGSAGGQQAARNGGAAGGSSNGGAATAAPASPPGVAGPNGSGNGNGAAGSAGAAVPGSSGGAMEAAAAAAPGPSRNGAAGGPAGLGSTRIPVVVTGDFNTLPGSKTCHAFRQHELGLHSLWEHVPLEATLSSDDSPDAVPPPPACAPSASGANGGQQQQQHPPANGASNGSASTNGGGTNGAGSNGGGNGPSNGAGNGTSTAAPYAPPQREFSTWKFRVKGESKRISDYIYYSGGGLLRPLMRWRMLTEDEIGPEALPNRSYASDHVSLCCEFEWAVDSDLEWAPASSKELEWG